MNDQLLVPLGYLIRFPGMASPLYADYPTPCELVVAEHGEGAAESSAEADRKDRAPAV